MPRSSPMLYNFNAGEWSPLMAGRVTHEKYSSSCVTLENIIPTVQGPAQRRGGTMFLAAVKDSSAMTRLLEFEFSTTQAYIIEAGNNYFRFYKDRGIITATAQNITGITQANPAVVTYSGADTYTNGDRVIITGVVGMTQVNNREFTVANVNAGANTFELSGVNSTAYDAYVSDGTVAEIYEISSPYATADLFSIQTTQSADVLYLAHGSYAPRKLTRTGHTSWTLTEIDFLDGPYLAVNTTSTTLTLSGTSGSVTVTASASTFASTDVGRLIRWRDPASNWTWLEITAYTSATVVTATIRGANASATTATTSWRLGAWSATTGYPAAVTIHEQRLFWGGTSTNPQTVWGSKSADYENHAPSAAGGTVSDDSALTYTLPAASRGVNVIRWMAGGKVMGIGTVGAEFVLGSGTANEPITPTNVRADEQTTYGSSTVRPIRVGNTTLFTQRSGRKVREQAYDFDTDSYVAPNMSILAEHATVGGITDAAFQQEPFSILWLPRSDGQLLGMTYERPEQVIGWHRHIIGGVFSTGDPVVESVAVIPSPDGDRDDLWMVVKRTVNSATVRYVEYMTQGMAEDATDTTDAFFVDGGLTYDGSATTTIGGLWHLEGQTVSILADGATHPDKTVSNGKVTLERSSSTVHIGLPYISTLETQDIEAGAADGAAQGKTKRIGKATLRFYNTLGCKAGPDEDNLDVIPFRSSADEMDTAPALFTGDREFEFPQGWDKKAQIMVRQEQPLPMTLVAIMPNMSTNKV